MTGRDTTPLAVTVSGEFAAQLRELADLLGWSLTDLVGHVVSNLSELASRGLLVGEDAVEYPPCDPRVASGTEVTVTEAR